MMSRATSSRTATAGWIVTPRSASRVADDLLVARVLHDDDDAVVPPLEGDRQVGAGEVLRDQAPDVGEDRALREVDVGHAELVGDRGHEVLLADELVRDQEVAQVDALGRLPGEELIEDVA